jgi:hypothetical protein
MTKRATEDDREHRKMTDAVLVRHPTLGSKWPARAVHRWRVSEFRVLPTWPDDGVAIVHRDGRTGWEMSISCLPGGPGFVTVERGGEVVYDSRADVRPHSGCISHSNVTGASRMND